MSEPPNNPEALRRSRPAAPETEPAAPRRVRPSAPTAPMGPATPLAAGARRSMFLQRTIIPILLTLCVMSVSLAVAWTMLDADSPFREFGPATPLILLGTGLLCGITGAITMISVRRALANRPR